MKAITRGVVLAEAPETELVRIEGNWYFPPASLTPGVFTDSATAYTCPWKGRARYFDATLGGDRLADAGWSYPEPDAAAIRRVGADFSGYVAFDPATVTVE
ncbi:DUF427 domain-containing protein [Amycolatopsis jiangsuensis]|uniref:Uncharacterized protein (DUF427 family) n=1 Tax=Amycolatopsis jiangsuensis TaxID=1181879 RepID=A0A840ISY8_9PSEU|nr:DUF427 domain-containing protein [Amycolatopsis jiangsuensis]MBB4684322.1 uncharacterized protein (DUF427 family) [Amycolatopsis jiangsuensis]